MLAASRTLHRAGYQVAAASSTRLAAAQWSRSCAERIRAPDPRQHAAGFINALGEVLERRRYATVLAGTDSALLAISEGRARLEGLTRLGLPPPDAVERSLSREALEAAAKRAGLQPVEAVRCWHLDQGIAAAGQLGFPVVLKPAYGAQVTDGRVTKVPKARQVSDALALEEALPAFHGEFLVQRLVSGNVVSFAGVMADGALLGVACAIYRRTWPPHGGSVAFGRTVACPPGLEEKVSSLVGMLGWKGIFELELIESPSEGLVPIDFNPRPYGSMAVAARAGAPLAAIWCDWLLGRSSPQARARPGHPYRWEDGDLRHLAWQLRHGDARSAAAVLRTHRSVTHAHYQGSDPLPLLARGLYLCLEAFKRSLGARFFRHDHKPSSR